MDFDVKDCHNPKFVYVGKRKIYLCGWRDEFEKEKRIISKLDLFIGLDKVWAELLPNALNYNGSNNLVKSLPKFETDGLKNIIIWHIEDGGVNEKIASQICKLSQQYQIGFGCIGGHGRTGWVLGYLINKIEGLNGKDLLHEVRYRWCKKAIESSIQFESLGIKEPYKKNYDFDGEDEEER